MNQKQKKIIESAIAVFSRYGIRRTTVGDIARQAGISRQTLYVSYANKEDIAAAAIGYIADKCVKDIRKTWKTSDSISEKLDRFFDIAVVSFFDQIRKMPDAIDLMTGIGEAGAAEMKRGEALKVGLLSREFAPYEDSLGKFGTDPEALADFVYKSASAYTFAAHDETHLCRLISVLKAATMALLGEC